MIGKRKEAEQGTVECDQQPWWTTDHNKLALPILNQGGLSLTKGTRYPMRLDSGLGRLDNGEPGRHDVAVLFGTTRARTVDGHIPIRLDNVTIDEANKFRALPNRSSHGGFDVVPDDTSGYRPTFSLWYSNSADVDFNVTKVKADGTRHIVGASEFASDFDGDVPVKHVMLFAFHDAARFRVKDMAYICLT